MCVTLLFPGNETLTNVLTFRVQYVILSQIFHDAENTGYTNLSYSHLVKFNNVEVSWALVSVLLLSFSLVSRIALLFRLSINSFRLELAPAFHAFLLSP